MDAVPQDPAVVPPPADRKFWAKYWKHIVLVVGIIAVIALVIYFLVSPEDEADSEPQTEKKKRTGILAMRAKWGSIM